MSKGTCTQSLLLERMSEEVLVIQKTGPSPSEVKRELKSCRTSIRMSLTKITASTNMGKRSKFDFLAHLWECTEAIYNYCHSGGSQYSQRPLTAADLSTGQGLDQIGFNLSRF